MARSLAALNVSAKALECPLVLAHSRSALQQRSAFFCHSIPELTWAGNCKTFALLTFRCQQDPPHRVYLLMGCFYLPRSMLCCQNDMKEL